MSRLKYIGRRLSWLDEKQKKHLLADKDILEKFQTPVVVLAPPGMGKTRLMEELARWQGAEYIRAKTLLRQEEHPLASGHRLIIDGLDEVSSTDDGDALHKVLSKLAQWGRPNFAISCRAAEWDSVVQGSDILDDYGARPVELILEPLERADATEILREILPDVEVDALLDKLDAAGLGELCTNPLMLEFVASISDGKDEFPSGRGELYRRAASGLCVDKNPLHPSSRKLQGISVNQALFTAGAIMATLLLSGRDAVVATSSIDEPSLLPISDLADLVDADHMRLVLKTKLFKVQDSHNSNYVPFHKTIAEFLGAYWLAEHVSVDQRPIRMASRVHNLFTHAGGVPSSLRGLHAWLAYFSPTIFGPHVIEVDPYGIHEYGDAASLPDEELSRLLCALQRLSTEDPAFRENSWERQSSATLVRKSILGVFLRILMSPDTSWPLRSLLLEGLKNSDVTPEIEKDLWELLRSSAHSYRERYEASEVLISLHQDSDVWTPFIEGLLCADEEDSSRLAIDVMDRVGFGKFSDALIVDAVISETGIKNDPEDEEKRDRVYGGLYLIYRDIPLHRIESFLDLLSARVSLIFEDDVRYKDRHDLSTALFDLSVMVNELISRLIAADASSFTPLQFLKWLRALERERGYQRDARDRVADFLKDNADFREAVWDVAFGNLASSKDFYWESYKLQSLSIGLKLQDDDILRFLRKLADMKDVSREELWRALVSHFWGEAGLPKEVRALALTYANNRQDLLDFIASMNGPRPLPEWKVRENIREKAEKEAQEIARAKMLAEYDTHLEDLKKGQLEWIYRPSKVYLGLYRDLDENASPEERVRLWLEDKFVVAVQTGLEAVLHRSDLPTTLQITEGYAKSQRWNFVFPMIAGAAQRLLRGEGLADFSDDLLTSIVVSADREGITESAFAQSIGLDKFLHDEMIGRDGVYERYLRQKFEPQFAAESAHVSGLYALSRSRKEPLITGSLILEWLTRYPNINIQACHEMVGQLLLSSISRDAEVLKGLEQLAMDRLEQLQGPGLSEQEISHKGLWGSVLFATDFEKAATILPPITMESRGLLWQIASWFHGRYGEDDRVLPLSIDQAAWLVRHFRSVWPKVLRPRGTTSGDRNTWDATNIIEWALGQIAKHPSPYAAEVLRGLRNEADDGYSLTIQIDIARQIRARREAEYKPPKLEEIKSGALNKAPKNAADVQSIVIAELIDFQARVKGDRFNVVKLFYNEKGQPLSENECRDRLFNALGQNLPFGIQSSPEAAMPNGKRSDAIFGFNDIAIPMEAKGQWHKDVWTAAEIQLDRLYATEYRAASKGIYLVFWFGKNVVAGKRLKPPPRGIDVPETSDEMRESLEALLPEHRRGDIAVFVLDLSRG
ncbi:NACHT domain-containing protein [Gimibacter soli]|uniref:Uncharacterized protein n=1 Tax=Gimibacter soli TaxID=3024400 RepID=A0AAE9XSL6_9PROT|nr:hypothetical protein [Gimibacter soli]WCL55612.1 hypothetical protein PH603_07535 [Gimibacter soli]